ncbi:MAG: carbohydrate ABC transporter permease [Chloroflexi bacterium]|nr:carbohydrate ABC transporter permease [Chloroflexota bacterium]
MALWSDYREQNDEIQAARVPTIRRAAVGLVKPDDLDGDEVFVLLDDPGLQRATAHVPGYEQPLELYLVEQTFQMAAVVDEDGDPEVDNRAYVMMIDPDNPPDVMPTEDNPAGAIKVLRDDTEEISSVFFDLGNYEGAIDSFDFLTYLRNSVVVTVVATVITLLINSMAGFALSKYDFRGRNAIFLIIIATLMIPISVILIPAFLVISEVGWANNLWGLIIPGAATPTGVFLLRQYMLTIPDELLDSARIDGASEWRIYWQIILPLARPALAVLAIFSVMWRWNDFLWPLIVVTRNDLYTLPVALNNFQGNLNVQWNYILAMTVLTLLPVTLVFAFLQRYITTGIATTGMK